MTGGCCFTCIVPDGTIVAGTFLRYSTVLGFLLADLQRSRTLSPQRKPVRHVSLELTTLPRRYPYTSPLGIRKVRHASVEEVSFNCVSEDYHHSMPCVHELKIYFESLSQIEDRGLTLRGMALVCHFKSPVRLSRIYRFICLGLIGCCRGDVSLGLTRNCRCFSYNAYLYNSDS